MVTQEAMDGRAAVVDMFGSTDPSAEPFARIKFQFGPVGEVGVNGCTIEDVIDVLVTRLEGFQRGPFRCRENALAITKLEEAKHWLLERTRKRQAQGVEGTNAAHQE